MERQISYPEKELKARFEHLKTLVRRFEDRIEMMEEQAVGLRDTLDWKSSAKDLRVDLEITKRVLDDFGVSDFEYNWLLENSHRCFDEQHVKIITDRFLKRVAENVENPL